MIYGLDCGGGGYGSPLERDVLRVLEDVLEGWVSLDAARDLYGVVLEPNVLDGELAVNIPETESLRTMLRSSGSSARDDATN
jgi:N-methylhydantoinase B